MTTYPQGFVAKRETNFFQHKARIEQLIKEGMHDGKGWKPEAFARYNELEDAEMQQQVEIKINKSLGQIAFEAYNIHAFDKAWEELPDSIQNGWHIVGETVAMKYADWLIAQGYLKESAPVIRTS